MVKDRDFPKSRHRSAHAVGWLEPEVDDWLIRRPPFDAPTPGPKHRWLRR
jgi:hypothetical protein